MTARPVRRPGAAVASLSLLALVSAGLSACESGTALPGTLQGTDGPSATGAPSADARPAARLRLNVRRGETEVPVDTVLAVRAQHASLESVTVTSPAGDVEGRFAEDGASWRAGERLEPGAAYTVRSVGRTEAGEKVTRVARFTTQDLSLAQQTYASVAPLDGETVGVGMPVVVTFDVPVTDRAEMERHMHVRSAPQQPGTWHWISDSEAHWRPRQYWETGTEVHVDLDVNGVSAGGGVYGQHDREIDFTVGDAHVYRVDARTHQMKVFANGELLRTLPVTTGKPGFETRNGVKVIIEKFDEKRMNSETVGIASDSAEAYDIDDVQWAMRLTYSGEFIHAAPWSVGSQGRANVSHGCTGMSPADAGWLYSMTRRGDVVETVGTNGDDMTLTNGYGDWNVGFKEYREGSAL
jgi:lipoprotein-anchoring transpeptidase ErfK/SrfK